MRSLPDMGNKPAQVSSTLSQRVAQALAEDIVNGSLPPGCKLEEKVLAERFGVSRTPVRDALRELAIGGLVEVSPRRGATVVQVDLARLRDMFETASEIEALCARFAAERMTGAERLELKLVGQQGQEAVARGDHDAYARVNERFHGLIFDGARNSSLAELARTYRIRLHPFRAQMFYEAAQRMNASEKEHERVIAAILARDAAEAQAAMREHLLSASLNVIRLFQQERGDGRSRRHSDSRRVVSGP